MYVSIYMFFHLHCSSALVSLDFSLNLRSPLCNDLAVLSTCLSVKIISAPFSRSFTLLFLISLLCWLFFANCLCFLSLYSYPLLFVFSLFSFSLLDFSSLSGLLPPYISLDYFSPLMCFFSAHYYFSRLFLSSYVLFLRSLLDLLVSITLSSLCICLFQSSISSSFLPFYLLFFSFSLVFPSVLRVFHSVCSSFSLLFVASRLFFLFPPLHLEGGNVSFTLRLSLHWVREGVL